MTDNRPVRQTLHDMDDRLAETNRQLDQSNTLAAMQLGAQIGQAALQGQTNRLMAEADDLLDEANRQRTETNKRLTRMGVTQEKTLEATRSVETAVAGTTREIRLAADRTERLIGDQNTHIDRVGAAVWETDRRKAGRDFAMWRQTDDGKLYLAWRTQAEHAVNRMRDWTERMNTARKQDVEDNTQRLLADRMEMIDRNTPDKPNPPEKPEPVEVDDAPAPFTEPEPQIRRAEPTKHGGMIIPVSIIAGMVIAPILYRVTHDTPSASSLLLFVFIGFIAGTIIGFMLHSSFSWETPPTEAAMAQQREDEERHRKWAKQREMHMILEREREAQLARNKRIMNDYENEMRVYRMQYSNWKHRYDGISIRELTQDAKRVTPPPTRWAVENPMPRIREWLGIIDRENDLPAPETLPPVEIPAFASPESIPDTAPCMRAELCRIISEETTRPAIEDKTGTA